jgi:hypothetical protein
MKIIDSIGFNILQPTIQGQAVDLEAQLIARDSDDHEGKRQILEDTELHHYHFGWTITGNEAVTYPDTNQRWKARWIPKNSGPHTITLTVSRHGESLPHDGRVSHDTVVLPTPVSVEDATRVRLVPAASDQTNDDGLFQAIEQSTASLDFRRYQTFVDQVMCGGIGSLSGDKKGTFNSVNGRRSTVFPGIDAYQRLKVATEVYLMLSVRVLKDYDFAGYDRALHKNKHGQDLSLQDLQAQWDSFLTPGTNTAGDLFQILPIDDLIRSRLKESVTPARQGDVAVCQGILQEKLQRPAFFELIWSYWHEEGMLVQTMKAIALRFQNHRTSERDPLASFDVAPLHPLSNLLWGYIQDEQHRLTVPRRAYEYDHHYGIALDGKVVPKLRSADSRSKFIEAFHNLLHGSLLFFKRDDDTTIKADGFPVLNGLKEVHLLLREGMHNQFGDLPSTARQEMLMEQWILARHEMHQFLGGRAEMPYSEDWMDRVDTMKKLKGWTDVSVTYFNDLAKYGEQLLLSIRHGDWSNIPDATFAAHWARESRPRIQQYVHAYRTVTGVDLSPEQTDVRLASDRYVQPAVHLRKRLDAQRQGAASPAGFGSPRIAATAAGRNGNGKRPAAGRPNGASAEMEFSEDFE